MTVSPDITLEGGTSLNARLAAMMPMASGGEQIQIMPETSLENGTEYSLVITPASGDMAGYRVGIDNTLSNEEGAPLSGSASVVDGLFSVKVFSYNGVEEEDGEVYPNETAFVSIYIGSIM